MKNLVVCCDGTWNTPDQVEAGKPAPTNVVKLRNLCVSGDAQQVYYHPGVGTGGGLFDKLLGGGLGVGLSANVQSAYEWLCRHYETGDRIYLFGFSRGAFTARSLSGFVTRCGILDLGGLGEAAGWSRVRTAYEQGYRARKDVSAWGADFTFVRGPVEGKVDIHFLGVWDTVGALGIPDDLVLLDLLVDDPAQYRFHDTNLSPLVRHARHALAMDEQRASFSPTLWTGNAARPADGSLKQIWFPGTHADVGGGHADSGLSDGALKWMADEACAQGLRVHESLLAQIQPDARGTLHDSAQGVWALLRTLPRAVPEVSDANVGSSLSPSVLDRHRIPPITQAPYWPTARVTVNEPALLDVYARPHWNATGFYLEQGVRYAFSAEGQWLDASVACGPDGPPQDQFQAGEIAQFFGSVLGSLEDQYKQWTNKKNADWWGTKRFEPAAWFALVGMIANQPNADAGGTPIEGETFRIGSATTYTPKQSGYLYCYANDAWKFYGNNRGKVRLRVTRQP